MDLIQTEKALNDFGKRLVRVSKTNLTKKDKNASKKLYDSIAYELNISKNSFQFDFLAEDYAEYVNDGVKGVGGTKADGSPWVLKKVTKDTFSYKEGIENKPSRKHFDKWIVVKGFAPRSSTGQFMSRRQVAEAIAYSVWRRGLETTEFYSRPFDSAFDDLPETLINKFGLDTESFLKTSIANDKK